MMFDILEIIPTNKDFNDNNTAISIVTFPSALFTIRFDVSLCSLSNAACVIANAAPEIIEIIVVIVILKWRKESWQSRGVLNAYAATCITNNALVETTHDTQ